MNLIDATLELVTNPEAECITFNTESGEERVMKFKCRGVEHGEKWGYLVFPATATKGERTVVASAIPFMFRQDFVVRYKSEYRKLTTKDIKEKVSALLEELERRAS